MKIYDVIVIGGGPAGMFAAGTAAQYGNNVLLLEKNDSLGKKLLITGKGRCNITNSGDIRSFIQNYGKNGKFLYRAFYEFFNTDLINFFESYGVKTKVERGGRIFPAEDKAEVVLDALKKFLFKTKVKILYNSKVKDIELEKHGQKKVVLHNGQCFISKNIVLATGGLSYPFTGSEGDGYKIAEKLGHKIIKLLPGLVPLETQDNIAKELQGLSLKNVKVSVIVKDNVIVSEFGEMIFTHYGVSGPIILKLSNKIIDLMEINVWPIFLSINFKPALTQEQIKLRLIREFSLYGNKIYFNVMKNLLPKKLVPVFVKLSEINVEKRCNQITKIEIKKIISLMTDFRLGIKTYRPIEEAIVTRGGINLADIDPYTMESKIVKGIYFCGEIIDIDGTTGGYNLQLAFSTGYLAGKNSFR